MVPRFHGLDVSRYNLHVDPDQENRPSVATSRRDELVYVAPMAVFLLFTQAASWWLGAYPQIYVIKTVIVVILLAVSWRRYTRIRWDGWPLGIVFGIIGIGVWVGTDKLLQSVMPAYPHVHVLPFNPVRQIANPGLRISFIAIRWAAASLLVPVMEELFWRDFVWRTTIAPNNFRLATVGEFEWGALLTVTILFATVHVQWPSAIAWGLLIGLLLIKTRSLGACIVMHGVTNLLLGLYVLSTGDWSYW